jgi:glycosyltransferase involved in cell wall biosynthesis
MVQIIDSLEAGGAERMAVNYANALSDKIDFSGLVVTRKEGPLLNQLDKKVAYCFLNKKSSIDVKAVSQLRKFVVKNKVEWVHAHSTSFFIAFLLKLSLPSLRLIWHDHYGDSEFLDKRPCFGLKRCLPFFRGIIAVNQSLKIWAETKMHFNNVMYLPNFTTEESDVQECTSLFGIQGKRLLSLANLREQKDHFLLLEVAQKIKQSHPDWTFHLVGKDFEDAYSTQLKNKIVACNLDQTVFIYGSRQDVKNIVAQSTIAILTSKSEGLPVALLEYGWYKKPIVITKVGEIPLLIQDGINGFMVPPANSELFYNSLVNLMEHESLQNDFANALHKTITDTYSEQSVIENYLNWIINTIR